MGTRCIVRVESESGRSDPAQLYHHFDDYPSNMLGLLRDAWALAEKENTESQCADLSTPGKVACYIAAADLSGYEIEDASLEHGDLDYDYIVTPRGARGAVTWHLTVRRIPYEDGPVTLARGPLADVIASFTRDGELQDSPVRSAERSR